MTVLSDSLSVLVDHWLLIAGIVFLVLLCQLVVWSGLKGIPGERLTRAEYFSLSLAGWMVPGSIGSLFFWAVLQGSRLGALLVIATIAILALFLSRQSSRVPVPGSSTVFFMLAAAFALSVFLRLAFLSRAVLPMYFDSAQHYLIISDLLGQSTASTLLTTTGYYHTGFHLLAAFLVSAFNTDIVHAMLILGQMTLAVIPLSIFFLIHHETRSGSAGIFSVLLAAVGWYMPAYAVNWGKYPALSSLPLITFVLSLAYLSLRYRSTFSSRNFLALNGLLLLSILVAGFTHSRALVVIAIFVLAWMAATWWTRLSYRLRALFFLAAMVGIAALVVYIVRKGLFGPLFDPYWDKGLFVTAIVAVLSIPGLRAYPRLAFTSLLVILLSIGSLFIPVRGIPGYANLTLLDRPFVEMILYFPLSILGGLGLAGLEQSLRTAQLNLNDLHFAWGKYLPFICIAVILIHELPRYNFYPSDCCAIAGRDDLVAIDWMDKNLPAEARVLIASTELRVLASNAFEGSVSGDAGAWITPLTGRATVFLPFQSDFSQQTTLDTLCQLQANHIFVGETGVRFDNASLLARPHWYKILLSMPNVQVYQVTGCP